MKLIYVCSPLRGNIAGNVEKAKGYCKTVIEKGHIPIAPHVAYQGILNDDIQSEGMKGEVEAAQKLGIPVQ